MYSDVHKMDKFYVNLKKCNITIMHNGEKNKLYEISEMNYIVIQQLDTD